MCPSDKSTRGLLGADAWTAMLHVKWEIFLPPCPATSLRRRGPTCRPLSGENLPLATDVDAGNGRFITQENQGRGLARHRGHLLGWQLMFCGTSRHHRLDAGTGDAKGFGITRTGRQDDQQAKSKHRAHAEICDIMEQPPQDFAFFIRYQ
jgi:hypothetical protein